MTIVTTICVAVNVRGFRHSSSHSNWRLIVNSNGVDVVSALAHPVRGFGTTTSEFARDFPVEGYARVYAFGVMTPTFDLIPATIGVDTATLNPSSVRIEMAGDDLLRASHVLLWGIDAAGAIVPLSVDADLPNLSTDAGEGSTSVPLTVVDSGDDATVFTEVYLYVALTSDGNAMTNQPVSFRLERADGTLIRSTGLDDFEELSNDSERSARIWKLVETEAASRVDATGPAVPILRVDGPNNAMINCVVAFGVNRDGPRPVVVPLVHHVPSVAGTNPWVGTSTSPDGREMVLPLCAAASRQ